MNETFDRWIQRASLAALFAVALTLLTVGIALYARPADGAGAPHIQAAEAAR